MQTERMETPETGDTYEPKLIFKKKRLNTREASRYLDEAHGVPCAVRSLAKMRCVGGGPRFQKFGARPLYLRSELDAWVEKKISAVRASSSDV